MKNCLCILAAAALVGGCAMPTSAGMASASYGDPPQNMEKAEAIVRAYLQRALKDPSSAQLEGLTGPMQFAIGGIGGVKYGWRVCARINAKNSYGGYVGFRPYLFLIRDGQVIFEQHGDGVYMDAAVESSCSK